MVDEWGRTRRTLLVEFLNTAELLVADDVLTDERASDWLLKHGATAGSATPDELADLRLVREGLRQSAVANNGGEPDRSAFAAADRALTATQLTVSLGEPAAPPALLAVDAVPVREVIGLLVSAYLAEQATGGWSRVKACANPHCCWAYADSSRNASRRWCEMSTCGNQAKQHAWRSRRTGGDS